MQNLEKERKKKIKTDEDPTKTYFTKIQISIYNDIGVLVGRGKGMIYGHCYTL